MFHRIRMDITYIHHSSFLVECERCLLLFDYFEGELPSLNKEKPLYVFASHHHGDHFSPVIFSIVHPQITYILSSDIYRTRVPESLLENCHFISPHETLVFDEVEVATVKSTDEGVAFILKVETKVLYFAADLNDWYWKGESKSWNEQMGKKYLEEIKRLPSTLDIAFVPVDPRLEEYYSLGVQELLQHCTVSTLFPMHFWGDFSVCKKLEQELETGTTSCMLIEHTHQTWRLV